MSNLNRTKSVLVWVLGGSAAAMLLAAIIFQCFRANPGTAADESNRVSNQSGSGKTRVTSADNARPQTTTTRGNLAAIISQDGQNLDITRDEVAQECMRRVAKEVLDSMINRAIIQLACKKRGIEVTAAEVDQEIVRIASEFRIPIEQYLQMLQAERGISVAQYQRDVIWPMLALKKLAGNEITVTNDEIVKAFQREYGPRVKARMILFDNMRRAQNAWKQINEDKDGAENFEKYVQEFSVDPSSKSLDGSIPPIPRHSGSPNLENAAFKLKPNDISAIIQLDDAVNRYVILKCEGRTEPVVTKLDEQVQAELEDQIKKQKTQEQVAKVFESIKKTTRIDNILTGSTTAGTKPTAAVKPGNLPRPDESRPTGTKTGASPSAADTDNRPIRQTAAQGSSNNRVRPAAALDEDDLELPPSGKSSTATRPKK